MIQPQDISILTGIGIIIILIVLLIRYFRPRLKFVSSPGYMVLSDYPTASAGDVHEPDTAKSVSVEFNRFFNKDKKQLNPKDYLQFVVEGDSMQFSGIRNKDLLFVSKNFRLSDLKKFPDILVLRDLFAKPGESKYKVRRAWGVAQYEEDRFENEVRKIMASDAFKKLKKCLCEDGSLAYKGDEAVVKDFLDKRLPTYEKNYINCDNPNALNKTVVISTTFNTITKDIHFSIHPIANIVGIVKESYTVNTLDKD